jgi:hypothetical protein
MREIQAKKERLNFGKARGARIPLREAKKKALVLVFKV